MEDHRDITVLWLPEWYPGRTDATNGDFIERHAKAASAFVRVIVLYVGKDESLATGKTEMEKQVVSSRFIIYRVWYGSTGMKGAGERLWSLYRFAKLQRKMYRFIVREWGKIDLVHVHVALKAGLLAIHLRKKGIPYLVTEHWSGYYTERPDNIYSFPATLRRLNRAILQHASMLMPVCAAQGEAIARYIVPVPYRTIDNVVDTSIFAYRPYNSIPFRFVHASSMGYAKNVEGMIRVAARLAARGAHFEWWLIGSHPTAPVELARSLGLLDSHVFFRDAIDHDAMPNELQQVSALVLFSRYESQPCILIEALCCGLPVVTTAVGGVADVIDERNGILIPPDNEDALLDAIERIMRQYGDYDREDIARRAAARFGEESIGRQHLERYEEALAMRSTRI